MFMLWCRQMFVLLKPPEPAEEEKLEIQGFHTSLPRVQLNYNKRSDWLITKGAWLTFKRAEKGDGELIID